MHLPHEGRDAASLYLKDIVRGGQAIVLSGEGELDIWKARDLLTWYGISSVKALFRTAVRVRSILGRCSQYKLGSGFCHPATNQTKDRMPKQREKRALTQFPS